MGILFLVATPIGNLKDISLRALETLKEVDLVAAEDTRHTGLLLSHYEIKKPMVSYQEYNEIYRIPELIGKLKSGLNVALVSDAGTPTISDPGFKLVRQCVKEGINVQSIPGASSVLVALTSSGLPTDKFIYLGYLPKKSGRRIEMLKRYDHLEATLIFFESPFRLVEALEDILKALGDRSIVVTRELTKIHEEIKRGSVSEVSDYFKGKKVKGEITIVLGGE
ncbi:MAG: 16S rRNA (cytidine(1402)-2'-O)-methyltransferase [Patescibacteria group bacterium]|nr:16S rRNA (cytidine(1402)-2'-O)-methyltransferase [Patescibacteria group bacterium]MCL5411543.1 16S rRNA (cytidine(1402)-2'-O)-methyltransferase [Patescibacteria group bacterium]